MIGISNNIERFKKVIQYMKSINSVVSCKKDNEGLFFAGVDNNRQIVSNIFLKNNFFDDFSNKDYTLFMNGQKLVTLLNNMNKIIIYPRKIESYSCIQYNVKTKNGNKGCFTLPNLIHNNFPDLTLDINNSCGSVIDKTWFMGKLNPYFNNNNKFIFENGKVSSINIDNKEYNFKNEKFPSFQGYGSSTYSSNLFKRIKYVYDINNGKDVLFHWGDNIPLKIVCVGEDFEFIAYIAPRVD